MKTRYFTVSFVYVLCSVIKMVNLMALLVRSNRLFHDQTKVWWMVGCQFILGVKL